MNKPILTVLAGILTAASVASAQNIQKANNSDALNQAASWIQGTVPGDANTAVFDNNDQVGLSVALGASMTWGGINILNPGGAITFPSDGNTLTLGTNGLSGGSMATLSLAASQSLTINDNVALGTVQNWNVGANGTLTLGANILRSNATAVRFNFGSGGNAYVNTTDFPGGALLLTGGNIPFGTINGTDYAAVASGTGQIIPISTSGFAQYAANPTANPPSTSGTLNEVMDCVNSGTGDYGIRASSTLSIWAVRFNQPNTSFPYWQINIPSSRNFSVGSILVTPGVGSQPVTVVNGGGADLVTILGNNTGGGFANTNGDLLLFQNNPSGSLIFSNGLTIRQVTGDPCSVTKMGVGLVEMQSPGTYTGGTFIYEGTYLIDGLGNVGTGALNVYGGNFEGQTGAENTAPETVDSGATNSVYVATANGQFTNNNSMTFGAGTATLQFIYANGVSPSSTTAALLVTNGALTANGTVDLNVICGSLAVGTYPLIQYAPTTPISPSLFTLVGLEPHVTAQIVAGANNTVALQVISVNQPIHWTASSGTWDISGTENWADANNNPTFYEQFGSIGDNVVFSDAASGLSPIAITLNIPVTPSSVTASGPTKNYSISGTGSINGTGSVTKSGGNTLTISTANAFSGGLNLNGGIVNFAALNNVGTGAITFGGGTLQYASGNTADISSLKTVFASGGATIDTGGNTVSFANAVGSGGAGGLTKAGASSLTLNGANTYTGATAVSTGTLLLGASASLPDSSTINVGGSTVFDVSALASFTLGGSVSQTLSGTGTVNGTIVTGANGTVSVSGSPLSIANLTVGAGALDMAISSSVSELISVPGTLTLNPGTGKLALSITGTLANGNYPLISYGSFAGSVGDLALSGFSEAGHLATLSSTAIPNTISLVVVSAPNVNLVWAGTSSSWDVGATPDWYVNGNPADTSTFANGDTAEFNDVGINNTTVNLTGPIQPSLVNVSVTNASYSFNSGNLTGAGTGLVYNSHGSATLQVDIINNNGGGTFIGSSSTLQVGNGSTSGYLGSGPITNNGSLVYDQPDSQPAVGTISGSGSLTQEGAGTLTLGANNTYGGGTTISSGTLQIGAGGATGSVTGAILDNAALVFDNGTALAVGNAITGSGSVTFGGSGTVTLSGNDDYYGNTSVTNGIVMIGSATAIPNINVDPNALGVVNVNGGTTPVALDLAGLNVTLNALSGTTGTPLPLVTNSGVSGMNTLTLGDANLSSTYSGQIAENPSGAKLALNVFETSFTLDGPATLSGGITVEPNAGLSLSANGLAYTGPITLDNNSTFSLAYNVNAGAANTITIAPGATANFTANAQQDFLSGQIVGGATSVMSINSTISASGATPQWNSFYGTVITTLSGSMRFSDTAAFVNGGSNATWNVGGELTMRDTGTVQLGALVGPSSTLVTGIDGPTVSGVGTYVVGYLNMNTVYTAPFIGNNSLILVGTGSLTLSGTVTYAGNTTVSNGSLIINGSASLDYSTNIAVRTGGTLDFSGFSAYSPNNALTLGNLSAQVQTLSGGGTVNGGINALAGFSVIAPGDSATVTGNLTATGPVTIGGVVDINLDATNALTSDEITAPSFSIQPSATLVVANIGPANFTYGQKFQLFSGPVTFANGNVTLPSLGSCASLAWVNNLAVDGSISVGGTSCVDTTPGTLTIKVSAGSINLSWAANQIGWTLQAQTNPPGGINLTPSEWVNVAGSTSVNSVTIPITPADQDVYYRLVYP
jgi:fibronectin-binding autotransporter adhesin